MSKVYYFLFLFLFALVLWAFLTVMIGLHKFEKWNFVIDNNILGLSSLVTITALMFIIASLALCNKYARGIYYALMFVSFLMFILTFLIFMWYFMFSLTISEGAVIAFLILNGILFFVGLILAIIYIWRYGVEKKKDQERKNMIILDSKQSCHEYVAPEAYSDLEGDLRKMGYVDENQSMNSANFPNKLEADKKYYDNMLTQISKNSNLSNRNFETI